MCPFYAALAAAATFHFVIAVGRVVSQARNGRLDDPEIE